MLSELRYIEMKIKWNMILLWGEVRAVKPSLTLNLTLSYIKWVVNVISLAERYNLFSEDSFTHSTA